MTAILTNIGSLKASNAFITGLLPRITTVLFGDGNGSAITLDPTMTSLVNQVHSTGITSSSTVNGVVTILAEIPVTIGGFTIREVGLVDNEGDLVAIGNDIEEYKSLLSENAEELKLSIRIVLSNNQGVSVEFSNDSVYASAEALSLTNANIQGFHDDVTLVRGEFQAAAEQIDPANLNISTYELEREFTQNEEIDIAPSVLRDAPMVASYIEAHESSVDTSLSAGETSYTVSGIQPDDTLHITKIDYYRRKVNSAVTPIMTSNTTPSGVANQSDYYSTSYYAWKCFTGLSYDYWRSPTTTTDPWVQYTLPAAKKLKSVILLSTSITKFPLNFTLQASNDGVTFDNLVNIPDHTVVLKYMQDNTTAYYIELDIPDNKIMDYLIYRIQLHGSTTTSWYVPQIILVEAELMKTDYIVSMESSSIGSSMIGKNVTANNGNHLILDTNGLTKAITEFTATTDVSSGNWSINDIVQNGSSLVSDVNTSSSKLTITSGIIDTNDQGTLRLRNGRLGSQNVILANGDVLSVALLYSSSNSTYKIVYHIVDKDLNVVVPPTAIHGGGEYLNGSPFALANGGFGILYGYTSSYDGIIIHDSNYVYQETLPAPAQNGLYGSAAKTLSDGKIFMAYYDNNLSYVRFSVYSSDLQTIIVNPTNLHTEYEFPWSLHIEESSMYIYIVASYISSSDVIEYNIVRKSDWAVVDFGYIGYGQANNLDLCYDNLTDSVLVLYSFDSNSSNYIYPRRKYFTNTTLSSELSLSSLINTTGYGYRLFTLDNSIYLLHTPLASSMNTNYIMTTDYTIAATVTLYKLVYTSGTVTPVTQYRVGFLGGMYYTLTAVDESRKSAYFTDFNSSSPTVNLNTIVMGRVKIGEDVDPLTNPISGIAISDKQLDTTDVFKLTSLTTNDSSVFNYIYSTNNRINWSIIDAYNRERAITKNNNGVWEINDSGYEDMIRYSTDFYSISLTNANVEFSAGKPKLVPTATLARHGAVYSFTGIAGDYHTVSIKARASEYNFAYVILGMMNSPWTRKALVVNLTTGDYSTLNIGSNEVADFEVSVSSENNIDWEIMLRVKVDDVTTSFYTEVSSIDIMPTLQSYLASWTADGVSGAYIWDYIVTKDKPVNYTGANLIPYSDDYTNPYWNKTSFPCTIVANVADSLDGKYNASRLINDVSDSFGSAIMADIGTTVQNSPYCYLVKIKKDVGQYATVQLLDTTGEEANVVVDFDNKTITPNNVYGSCLTYNMIEKTNGWFIVLVSMSAPTAGATIRARVWPYDRFDPAAKYKASSILLGRSVFRRSAVIVDEGVYTNGAAIGTDVGLGEGTFLRKDLWVPSTVNDELEALKEALLSTKNQMTSVELNDRISNIGLTDTFDIGLNITRTSGTVASTSAGIVDIGYDKNQYWTPTASTDSELKVLRNGKIKYKALVAGKFRVRLA